MSNYVPFPDEEAMSLIGEYVHVGLRKGTEAPEAHDLWKAISDSDNAWSDAVGFAIYGLALGEIRLCRKVE